MNKKQELKLFGSVLPSKENSIYNRSILRICLGLLLNPKWADYEALLELARTQREAIGVLIEIEINNQQMHAQINFDTEKFILSIVLQDTWEQVLEAWKENE